MNARLPIAPVIKPLTCVSPDVVGVGAASAEIRGYVDAPVEVAGVTVYYPLLVVKGLAYWYSLFIGLDILRAQVTVITLDETAPVRLQNRECSIFRELRTDSLSV